MIEAREVPGQEPGLITEKDRALLVFHSFESMMKPFMNMFPEGRIEWNKGLLSAFNFEGEFYRADGSYIRFTEEIKRKES